MRYKDMLKMQSDEKEKKSLDLKTELMKLNAQVAIGTTPKSTKQIREIKKNMARLETMKTEQFRKELASLKDDGKKPKAARAKKYIHQ